MYDIPQEDIQRYFLTTANQDTQTRNNMRGFNKNNELRPGNVYYDDIDLRYKPANTEYGEVEYWNSSRQCLMLENVQLHKDHDWNFVHKMRHQELPCVTDDTREKFKDVRNPDRGQSSMYEFDTDDELIKRNGLVVMEKDAAAQREYENRLHTTAKVQALKTTEKGFNSETNEFGMTIKIQRDDDSTTRYNSYW